MTIDFKHPHAANAPRQARLPELAHWQEFFSESVLGNTQDFVDLEKAETLLVLQSRILGILDTAPPVQEKFALFLEFIRDELQERINRRVRASTEKSVN